MNMVEALRTEHRDLLDAVRSDLSDVEVDAAEIRRTAAAVDQRLPALEAVVERVEDQLLAVEGEHALEVAGNKASAEAAAAKLAELQSALDDADAALDSRVESLEVDYQEQVASLRAELDRTRTAQTETAEKLLGQVASAGEQSRLEREQTSAELEAELHSLGQQITHELSTLKDRIKKLTTTHQRAERSLRRNLESLESEFGGSQTALKELRAETSTLSSAASTVDVVSALRQVRAVWAPDAGMAEALGLGAEHGHALLMHLMAREARGGVTLAGKTLIEIGSTRERDPRQGSSEKLAVFTALAAMRFVTVDVDPEVTARVAASVQQLNPDSLALNVAGEDFLADTNEAVDFVYLDAFDYDHGAHSSYRRERYREVLGTEITDEASWRMHQLCAAALVTKMKVGGLVVIDDTWEDDKTAELCGKGKRAVPLLRSSGFEVVEIKRRAVALRRTAVAGGTT
jgi:predicted  nucleic acid-binding Zn-ribbon protein